MPNDFHQNAERFTGFADTYESARPSLPEYPVTIISRYLNRKPDTVIDLGCGTGLSTTVWNGRCHEIIGVEPSGDMLAAAQKRTNPTTRFIQAYGHDTGLRNACADVVICSQSFHWMEPTSTLREVSRLLRPGGVFATVDCDWPPVCSWQADQAYETLYHTVKEMEDSLPNARASFTRYPKNRHLIEIKNCGQFRYARELLFANTEPSTRERYFNILLSQGSLQTILRKYPGFLDEALENFRLSLEDCLPDCTFPLDFSYRMRIAVK